ncbi:MAG: membrane dipeptidase [Deltaproteobacteria bacterium]|nr:membrane dipeptidase [Deltaproteobacteria bacterium]
MPRGSSIPSARLHLRAALGALCALPLFAFGPCRSSDTPTAGDDDAPAVAAPETGGATGAADTTPADVEASVVPAATEAAEATGEAPADAGAGPGAESPAEAAARLLREALVIDLHADVVYQVADRGRDFATGDGEWTLERARRGGEDAQFFPLWLPRSDTDRAASLKRHARTFQAMLESAGDQLALVRTSAELRERAARGALSVLLGMEGADGLGDDPENLDPYAALGLRYLGLTWNDSNAFAEAAAEPREPPGLTEAGRALVARANDAGVLLDLAHASAATFWDVHRLSRSPLLVSHAALRALRDHSRNIDDLQLLALARTGGVLGVVWHSGFLAVLPEGRTRVPLETLLAHYDHARALGAGAALALGSDLDGGIRPPEGLDTIAELPLLAAGLLERGWSEAELRGLLGENVLRLLDAADAAVDGPRPTREWPAELSCAGAPSAKEGGRLSDRRVLDGPELAPGTVLELQWEDDGAATAATLEAWGEPGTRLAVGAEPAGGATGETATEGGAETDAVELLVGSAGSGRLELTAEQLAARRMTLTVRPRATRDAAPDPAAAVRLGELAVWLRGTVREY